LRREGSQDKTDREIDPSKKREDVERGSYLFQSDGDYGKRIKRDLYRLDPLKIRTRSTHRGGRGDPLYIPGSTLWGKTVPSQGGGILRRYPNVVARDGDGGKGRKVEDQGNLD